MYVGDTLPDSDYGFIRREVKIKHFSNATINTPDFINYKLYNTGFNGNVTFHDFSIAINTTELLHREYHGPGDQSELRCRLSDRSPVGLDQYHS